MTPPTGAIEVVEKLGTDRNRVAIFHSLSKRSNLPGLRSGFVASGADTIREVKQLRNYAGAPLPLPLQQAAAAVWSDETHVEQSRAMYQEKFEIADRIFGNVPGYQSPEAGFFLWLPVEDDEAAAVKLWKETGVKVLPGGYLAQDVEGQENPGKKVHPGRLGGPKRRNSARIGVDPRLPVFGIRRTRGEWHIRHGSAIPCLTATCLRRWKNAARNCWDLALLSPWV